MSLIVTRRKSRITGFDVKFRYWDFFLGWDIPTICQLWFRVFEISAIRLWAGPDRIGPKILPARFPIKNKFDV